MRPLNAGEDDAREADMREHIDQDLIRLTDYFDHRAKRPESSDSNTPMQKELSRYYMRRIAAGDWGTNEQIFAMAIFAAMLKAHEVPSAKRGAALLNAAALAGPDRTDFDRRFEDFEKQLEEEMIYQLGALHDRLERPRHAARLRWLVEPGANVSSDDVLVYLGAKAWRIESHADVAHMASPLGKRSRLKKESKNSVSPGSEHLRTIPPGQNLSTARRMLQQSGAELLDRLVIERQLMTSGEWSRGEKRSRAESLDSAVAARLKEYSQRRQKLLAATSEARKQIQGH